MTVPDAVSELAQSNAELRTELDAARRDVAALQNTVADLTPLRRHLGRVIIGRLGVVDRRIRSRLAPVSTVRPGAVTVAGDDLRSQLAAAARADAATFASFAGQQVSNRTLRFYDRASRFAARQTMRVLRGVWRRVKRLRQR